MEFGLKIGISKISGLSQEKMYGEVFKREINKYNILCETWLHKENINKSSKRFLQNFILKNKRRKKGRVLLQWNQHYHLLLIKRNARRTGTSSFFLPDYLSFDNLVTVKIL